jgi:hypothetical protein
MSFSVNLIALRGLPPFLDRRARELAATGDYVAGNTHLNYGPALVDIAGRHEQNVHRVTTFLRQIAIAYAGVDAARLRQATADYANSDRRAAERADAALPRVPGGDSSGVLTAAERALGPEIFNDSGASPTSHLAYPADHHADFPYHPSWFDLLSPTSLARDAVWKATTAAARLGILDRAYDPFEFLVCPLVGDWAGLLRCAEVFDHAADLVRDESLSLHGADSMAAEVWTGNAAAMCRANLNDFAVTLGSGEGPLRVAATAYRAIAEGVRDNADLLATVITELVDYAVESSINFGTWGIFSAYEVGSGISNLVRSLRAALRIVGKIQDIVSTGMNISDDAVHRLGLMSTVVQMPALTAPAPRIPVVR